MANKTTSGAAAPAASELAAFTLSIGVRASQERRFRAGRHFGPEERIFASGDLTEDELAAIEADPVLSVRRIAVEASVSQ